MDTEDSDVLVLSVTPLTKPGFAEHGSGFVGGCGHGQDTAPGEKGGRHPLWVPCFQQLLTLAGKNGRST